VKGFLRWQACRIRGCEIHNKAYNGLLHMVAAADSEPANLDQTGERRRRANQQLSADCGEMDTVVADQDGRWELTGPSAEDEVEGKARLPRAGGAADQDCTISHHHR